MDMKKLLPLLAVAALAAGEPTASRGVLKHREHNGIGYDTGYTTAELFLAPAWKNNFMPFLDVRGHIFDDSTFATNLGIGLRYNWSNWTIGGNFYYDFREAENINPHQLGGGLEFLSRYFDIRANGYGPIANTKFESPAAFSGFQGNSAVFQRRLRAALPAVDAEVGMPLGTRCGLVNWYAALGSYYLFEKTVNGCDLGDAFGGQGRITVDLINRFGAGFNMSYDKIFKWIFQGTVGVTLPLGPREKVLRSKNFLCQARNQLPHRAEIIPVEKKRKRQAVGNIIFVNNTSSSNGTFESPFPTTAMAMAESSPGDIIYIFPGDGTTTGYDTPLVMQSDQTIQGSGVELDLGDGFIVPAQTPGQYPKLLGSGLGAIVPSINSTITGLDITSSSIGIRTDDPTVPVGGTNIFRHNIIHDCTDEGMLVGNAGSGLNSVNYIITNNTCNNNGAEGIRFTTDGTPTIRINAVIADNTVDNNGAVGINCFFASQLNYAMALLRNTVSSSADDSIACTPSGSSRGEIVASRNRTTGGFGGLSIFCSNQSQTQLDVQHNSFSNTVFSGAFESPGFYVQTEDSSRVTGIVTRNEIFTSPNNLLEITPEDSSFVDLAIERNIMHGAISQGTLLIRPVSPNADMVCNLRINDNLFYNNTTDAILTNSVTAGTYSLDISGNFVTNTENIDLPIGGTSAATFNINNNILSTTSSESISINPQTSSSACVTLFGNNSPNNSIMFSTTANLQVESPTPGSSEGLAEINDFGSFNPATGSFYVPVGTCP